MWAAEILEEDELMARIARTSQYEPHTGLGRQLSAGDSVHPDPAQPGSLFQPNPSQRQP